MNAAIVSDPQIMMGKPVIAGTRITVESILDRLAAGEDAQDIVKEFPRLTHLHIRAALDFAASALRADVIYPSPQRIAVHELAHDSSEDNERQFDI